MIFVVKYCLQNSCHNDITLSNYIFYLSKSPKKNPVALFNCSLSHVNVCVLFASGGKDLSKEGSGCPSLTSEVDSTIQGEDTNTHPKVHFVTITHSNHKTSYSSLYVQLISHFHGRREHFHTFN